MTFIYIWHISLAFNTNIQSEYYDRRPFSESKEQTRSEYSSAPLQAPAPNSDKHASQQNRTNNKL